MKLRKLGKTDLKVSVIGMGTYQFGGRWGKDFTQDEVNKMFDAACDHGINLIDTAECYGENHLSESFIGNAIKNKRNKFILATKFGHIKIDKDTNKDAWSIPEIELQLHESLKALHTEHIDIYQLHSASNEIFDKDEIWTFLNKKVKEGKIRYYGVSLTRKSEEARIYQAKEAKKRGAAVIQALYNRLDREAERTIFPECINNKIGVLARVPLASGFLSGKYQTLEKFDDKDTRSGKYVGEKILKIQKEVDEIIKNELPKGMTLIQYALSWVLKHEAVSCIIPGCKTVEHVIQNAAASNFVSDNHPLSIK